MFENQMFQFLCLLLGVPALMILGTLDDEVVIVTSNEGTQILAGHNRIELPALLVLESDSL